MISWRDLKIFRKDLTAAESLLSAGLKLSPEKDRRLWNILISFLKVHTVMQVGVSYIDPQWMDVGKDIDAMYTGTMTPDEVFQNIEKRRTEQAQLQKDPAWAE